MFPKKKVWVLVADGARARIFTKQYRKLTNAMGQDFVADNLKDTEALPDKPGRAFESANSARHAYEPRNDWHEYQKELFAKSLCDILHKASEQSEFDELIIISPPRTLGELRNNLNKQVISKITAEFPKDITKYTEQELAAFLEKEF